MSTEKKIAPIQPSPTKPFTLRLINGHFIRVPKFDQLATTDSTRPPSTLRPDASPHGDGGMLSRGLRLVNGHFVNGLAPAAPVEIKLDQSAVAPARPVAPPEVSPDSWAYAFGTRVDPSDASCEDLRRRSSS